MKSKNTKMGLTLIGVAFVFLFNPNFNIVDILPDFIGYAFIAVALSRLSYMNEDIAIAHKGFSRAIILDLVKIGALLLVFGTGNPEEQNTMLLLVSFVFAVAELIVLIPAYKSLFGGLMGLGYRFENTSVLGSRHKGKKNRTEVARLFTYLFLTVKTAAYVLPEFAVLSTQSYDEFSSTLYIYDYIGLLRSFSIIVSLVSGIVWLCLIESYFARIRRDEPFMRGVVGEYNEKILPKTSLFVRRAVKIMSLWLFAAAVLCLDFRLESFNVLIDTFAALALIICCLSLKKHVAVKRRVLVSFVCYAAVSLAAAATEISFFANHYYSKIYRDDVAFSSYKTMLLFAAFDALAFLLAAWGIGKMLRGVIKDHTGFFVPTSAINVAAKVETVHKELDAKVYLLYGAALVAAATDVFYDFFASTLRFAGLVNIIGSLVFVCAVFNVCYAICDEVEAKYMLD